MNSREKILAAIKQNQPDFIGLPFPERKGQVSEDPVNKFVAMLESIGGAVFVVQSYESIATVIKEKFHLAKRIVSACPELNVIAGTEPRYENVHDLSDTDLAVIRAHFGVAENAACWITEELMIERAVPFICQHLAVVLDKRDIVSTMHEAYDRIDGAEYGFGVFIAGPSKTADIEQSLVLGAHGPRSMTVFLLDAGISDAGFY
jgi:L-lactate dehydrogenase complex protein LldG